MPVYFSEDGRTSMFANLALRTEQPRATEGNEKERAHKPEQRDELLKAEAD